jgi:hypothetical protein
MDPTDIGEVVEYGALMEAALGYLAEAARIARENSFELPASWMSREMTNEELAEWAHAFRAHFRAAVARTPDERAAVDWAAVLADVAESGGTSKRIQIVSGGDFDFGALTNMNAPLWSQNNYHYTGMADQSGAYQDWIATPVGDRTPFVVVTPDQRFPQGATLDEQREGWEDADCPNEGLYWSVIGCSGLGNETLGAHHQQAARGTWRWSNYRLHRYNDWLTAGTRSHAEISEVQLRLLEAEAVRRTRDALRVRPEVVVVEYEPRWDRRRVRPGPAQARYQTRFRAHLHRSREGTHPCAVTLGHLPLAAPGLQCQSVVNQTLEPASTGARRRSASA